MYLGLPLCALLLNLAICSNAQSSTNNESPGNPPKKADGVMITVIVIFVLLVCLLIFYYSMNIIRKNRKREEAAALPKYADLTPLQGLQNQGLYNPSKPNPTIIVTPPEMPIDHLPQDDPTPPPYDLPKQPPPAQLRGSS
ncbi:unnamed protein product [Rhizoctonia solani]|uniref:Uncharacterized protein n=1 Tax=Rhizoctonia solani TaxID=456999 RepID=A0A8H3CXC1_9AGAM|nr:unnamed protein product [Rhizoctonia solani]